MQLAISQATVKGVQALRSQAAVFERYRGFDRCMRRLCANPHQPVPGNVLAELYAYWGDPLAPGAESFLRSCLAEAARAPGPILQCGAGLLTMVLGRLCSAGAGATANGGPAAANGDAAANGPATGADTRPAAACERNLRQLWCLEQDAHWSNVVRSWLTQYGVSGAHVITSQPRLFNQYVWYAVDPGRLAEEICLVVCEGARATPRGIIGTLQRVGNRLAPHFTVLARGVTRAEDLKLLAAWAKGRGAACVVVDRQEGFVKIACRERARDPLATPDG